MKKSTTVTLVLVTSALILGCQDKVRNRYDSLEDCLRDYKDPTQCYSEPATTGGRTGFYYYGPWYRGSMRSNPSYNPSVVTHRATGVVRGGWGSTGIRSAS